MVHEYYSGSEGVGFCVIGPEEWLAHPGSVGKSLMGPVHIVDADGNEVGPRVEGQVFFEPPTRVEYHGDPEKTKEAFNDRGWGTLGDIGWVDEEGYLYLTDRVSNMIISGGVNIYPREIEDILIGHPGIADAAVIGVPHPDFGESVRAIVEPEGPGRRRGRLRPRRHRVLPGQPEPVQVPHQRRHRRHARRGSRPGRSPSGSSTTGCASPTPTA